MVLTLFVIHLIRYILLNLLFFDNDTVVNHKHLELIEM